MRIVDGVKRVFYTPLEPPRSHFARALKYFSPPVAASAAEIAKFRAASCAPDARSPGAQSRRRIRLVIFRIIDERFLQGNNSRPRPTPGLGINFQKQYASTARGAISKAQFPPTPLVSFTLEARPGRWLRATFAGRAYTQAAASIFTPSALLSSDSHRRRPPSTSISRARRPRKPIKSGIINAKNCPLQMPREAAAIKLPAAAGSFEYPGCPRWHQQCGNSRKISRLRVFPAGRARPLKRNAAQPVSTPAE